MPRLAIQLPSCSPPPETVKHPLPPPSYHAHAAKRAMPAGGASSAGASTVAARPVTETQILPPQIPPQALRPSIQPTAGAGSASSGPSSASPPIQTPVPPPAIPRSTSSVSAASSTSPSAAPPPTTAASSSSAPAPTGRPKAGKAKTGAAKTGAPRTATAHRGGSSKASAPGKVLTTRASPKASARASAGQNHSAASLAAAQSAAAQLQQVQRPLPSPAQPAATAAPASSRAWSPPRPPISPILPAVQMPPHLAPTTTGSGTFYTPNFASGRPVLTHTAAAREAAAANAAAAAATAVAATTAPTDPLSSTSDAPLPPPPVPLDFATNPDVIALQNTLAILQLQKKRATADIQTLQTAKEAALANPAAFVQKLQNVEAPASGEADSDNSDDDDDEEEEKDQAARKAPAISDPRRLPQPQNVVRMPPINWNKYAIVGDGLERLHAEQQRRPALGAPAVASIVPPDVVSSPAIPLANPSGPSAASSDGLHAVYSFQGASDSAMGLEYVGVAAPFDPLRDRVIAEPARRGRSSKR